MSGALPSLPLYVLMALTGTFCHCFPVRLNTQRCAVAVQIRTSERRIDETQQLLDPVDNITSSYSGDDWVLLPAHTPSCQAGVFRFASVASKKMTE